MVDRDKMQGMIGRLREDTAFLRRIVEQDRSAFLVDPESVGSARYYRQVSIETCINLANHLIATEGLRAPLDYRDSFSVLNEAGILTDNLTS